MENDKRTKISPKTGRGLGHVTLLFLAVRSAILATAWLLVNKDYVWNNRHANQSKFWA